MKTIIIFNVESREIVTVATVDDFSIFDKSFMPLYGQSRVIIENDIYKTFDREKLVQLIKAVKL